MIVIPSMTLGYRTIIEHVLARGRPVSPRGMATLEVPDALIRLDNPTMALAIGTNRKLNLSIAAAEAVQLIGGFLDPQLLLSTSKNFAKFMDNGTFHGGYGTRIGNQVALACQKLWVDNDTRQAVIQIWDKEQDNIPRMHDYPCTLSLVFQVRGGALELHTTMRSNDVWLGLPYDIFQFTQLQITVARVLGFNLGPYYHHAVSLHLYDRDRFDADHLRLSNGSLIENRPLGFGNERTDASLNIFGVLQRAHMIGHGEEKEVSRLSLSEQWYVKQLEKHVTRK
jgi:thymidylate synthase